MPPHPDHGPAESLQVRPSPMVPVDVGGQLLPPPLCIVLGLRGVKRASVPEAAIDKDHNSPTCENDVTSHPKRFLQAIVDTESIAQGMDTPSDLDLESRVPAALQLHPSAYDVVQRLRHPQSTTMHFACTPGARLNSEE